MSTATCPEGWVKYGDSCFQFNTLKHTWVEAEETCRTTPGAHLASCLTNEETEFLSTKSGWTTDTWIGLNDL